MDVTASTCTDTHKTAYRPLDPVKSVDEVWATEPEDALFLYTHISFYEGRCGFCILSTDQHAIA
jgi:oxygen-independent coproporphyrinogen III oxidase